MRGGGAGGGVVVSGGGSEVASVCGERVYLGRFRCKGRERTGEGAHAFDARRLLDARTQRAPALQKKHVRVCGHDHLWQGAGSWWRPSWWRAVGGMCAGACGARR